MTTMARITYYRGTSVRCPTPGKRPFLTRRDAKAAAPKWVRPYLCACGRWHLTKRRNQRWHG